MEGNVARYGKISTSDSAFIGAIKMIDGDDETVGPLSSEKSQYAFSKNLIHISISVKELYSFTDFKSIVGLIL